MLDLALMAHVSLAPYVHFCVQCIRLSARLCMFQFCFINYTIRMCYTIKCFQLLPDTCFSKAIPWRGLNFIIDSSYINLPYYLCICHLSAWNHPPLYQLHTQNYQVFLRPGSASKMINKNIKLSKNVRKKAGVRYCPLINRVTWSLKNTSVGFGSLSRLRQCNGADSDYLLRPELMKGVFRYQVGLFF